ncbi:cysteine-rich VLP protein [Paenibacillus aestuarii]|uniref:Cysteine-rich VLP protein n=1 Tax=Paenibacillus aestuarii TaxID=516965 RepID=A0ABW0K2G3_9BACL
MRILNGAVHLLDKALFLCLRKLILRGLEGAKVSVLTEIQRLARNRCANFTRCDGCLIELDDRLTCRFFRDNAEGARCKYFESSVLPEDSGLEAKYFGGTKKNLDRCDMCRKDYVKTSNRQRYCTGCRDRAESLARRKRDARYKGKKATV